LKLHKNCIHSLLSVFTLLPYIEDVLTSVVHWLVKSERPTDELLEMFRTKAVRGAMYCHNDGGGLRSFTSELNLSQFWSLNTTASVHVPSST
jgi:hypothetical protein